MTEAMVDDALVAVTPEDRELFILLLGFDAVPDEASFERIRNGQFDRWKKMQRIARHRLAGVAAGREEAWRDGFNCARQCLTDDEAFCLTEDVEQDAWVDSKTATAIRQRGE